VGQRPLGAILHSSNEPGELSQWLCHDDSTLNIVLDIIIIIIIIFFIFIPSVVKIIIIIINTNYCNVYKSISACTFVAAFNKLYCIVLCFNFSIHKAASTVE